MTEDEIQQRLGGLFFPYATRRASDVRAKGSRFVHYSTAESAIKILRSKEVWMRKTTTMNDFMEVEYGFECLRSAWSGEAGAPMKEVVERLFPGACGELERRFDSWLPKFRNETFITCISEHLDSEDNIGRLSMWRAYGGGNGVAVVLNNTAFSSTSDALSAYTSPVAYVSGAQFDREFDQISRNTVNSEDLLFAIGRDAVISNIFTMMRFMIVGTKHPGFHEEKEWRILHTPSLEPSDRLPRSIEVIQGVPQIVHKIPLRNYPEEGFLGAEIPDLVERIIIGPSLHGYAMRDAFVGELEKAGVENAATRVYVSDIPLR